MGMDLEALGRSHLEGDLRLMGNHLELKTQLDAILILTMVL